MRLRSLTAVLTVVLGVLALAAGTAGATTITTDIGFESEPIQTIVNASYLGTPKGTVMVHPDESCPGLEGDNCFKATPTPQIYMDYPNQPAQIYLHELCHDADYTLDPSDPDINELTPIRREFEQIVGIAVGTSWYVEPSASSPRETWADTCADCSWLGFETSSPTIATPGYGFVLTAAEYDAACQFFQRVLTGPTFDPPTQQPPGPIPYNQYGSIYCGARPGWTAYCTQDSYLPPVAPPLPPAPQPEVRPQNPPPPTSTQDPTPSQSKPATSGIGTAVDYLKQADKSKKVRRHRKKTARKAVKKHPKPHRRKPARQHYRHSQPALIGETAPEPAPALEGSSD